MKRVTFGNAWRLDDGLIGLNLVTDDGKEQALVINMSAAAAFVGRVVGAMASAPVHAPASVSNIMHKPEAINEAAEACNDARVEADAKRLAAEPAFNKLAESRKRYDYEARGLDTSSSLRRLAKIAMELDLSDTDFVTFLRLELSTGR